MELTKGQKTRLRILESAIKRFARGGMEGTTFQLLADDCELKQSSVFRHFKDKTELLRASIVAVIDDNQAALAADLDPELSALEQLRAFGRGTLEWASSHRDSAHILLFFYQYSASHPAFQEFYQERLETARGRIRGQLLAAGREGDLPRQLDVDRASRLLHSSLLGIGVNFLASTSSKSRSGMRAELEAAKADWDAVVARVTG